MHCGEVSYGHYISYIKMPFTYNNLSNHNLSNNFHNNYNNITKEWFLCDDHVIQQVETPPNGDIQLAIYFKMH